MLDIQQKRKVRSVMYNRVTIGLLFLLVLFVLHSTWSVYKKEKESREVKEISEARIEELRQRDLELKAKISRLATVSGLEEEIRSKFSVAKEGENVIVVVQDEKSEVSTTSQKRGFWDIIKNLFN